MNHSKESIWGKKKEVKREKEKKRYKKKERNKKNKKRQLLPILIDCNAPSGNGERIPTVGGGDTRDEGGYTTVDHDYDFKI